MSPDPQGPPETEGGPASDDADLGDLTRRLAARLETAIPRVVVDTLASSGLEERIDGLLGLLASISEAGPIEARQAEPAPADDGPANGQAGEPPADAEGGKTCSEAGCQLPARARGLCSKHYQRLRYAERRAAEAGQPPPRDLAEARQNRGRTPQRKTERRGGGSCSQPGCDRPNYAKGMCGKHFMEWVRAQKERDNPD